MGEWIEHRGRYLPAVRDDVAELGGCGLTVLQPQVCLATKVRRPELGRWGMVANYFGSANPNTPPIWAEIQFTGWMVDGGIVMVAIYLGAIAATTVSQWRVAQATRQPRVAVCGAVVLASGLGPAIMILSFTPFVAQVGIQYWFLAGALHGVASRSGIRDA